MRLADLIYNLEEQLPPAWAEEWDNPGLTVGDPCREVSRIAVALDVTETSVRAAAAERCGLLISHHPAIFNPIKKLNFQEPGSRAIALAIQNGVALYAAHTNWDSSHEGVNFRLAEALALNDIEPLVPAPGGGWGLGAIGNLKVESNLRGVMKFAKERWFLSSCTGFGDELRRIRRVALGGGACADFWPRALDAGADVYITADVAYHHRNDALAAGLPLIAVDHGEMERVTMAALAALAQRSTSIETLLLDEKPLPLLIV